MCHEHVMVTTPDELQAAMDAEHDAGLYHLPFLGDAQDMFDTCKVWKSSPPYATENDPVFSDIPSLIIDGKFDPATPPRYGQQVAGHLSRSTYVEFPNMGHVPTASDPSGCAMKIAVAFFSRPESTPDLTCLSKLPAVRFILP
jgi:pimeloyl-ACP methyl ester carboxylesterase